MLAQNQAYSFAPSLSPPHGPSSSSSSSASLNSATTPTHRTGTRPSPPPTRKIRFAPLPDPRRSVLITDDGEELPIPNCEEATNIPSSPLPPVIPLESQQSQETSSVSSFGSSSKRNSDSTDPSSASGTTTPASMTNTTNSEASGSEPASPASIPICLPPTLPSLKASSSGSAPPSSWQKSKGLSFLRPFKRSSGSSSSSSSSNKSLTPTPSIDRSSRSHASSSRKGISTEEILTLGTINLFRTSSRESSDGWNLTRWSSAGPSSAGGPARNFGVPLTRTQSTQSTQSYKSKTKTPSLLSGLRPSSAPAPKPSKKNVAPVRTGTRMLNGRVYGSKNNPSANPFDNVRDEEPSFVEWGYGGMGSVKNAKSAGVSGYEKLGGGVDDDLEDGTGTAWLKKRREAREQKAREEREAKEKAEKEALESSAPENTSTEVKDDTDAKAGETATIAPSSTPLSAHPTASTITESAFPTPTASSADITASTLGSSATLRSKPSFSPLPSTAPSTPLISPMTPPREAPSPTGHSEEERVYKTMAIPMPRPHRSRSASNATFTHPVHEVDTKIPELVKAESESESETDSESESDREEDDDDDEEDEEDEEEEQRRKIVIGAGVEKVCYHRTDAVEESA
ncbi:hypothetical protein EST38_g1677 [Candolleomyces aberdarensis]|uniref:Uncharacterized protein n=1 Tax=Candolleomyces aberdarensis TaxID=2316362 RepID=A0A4Q2DV79_9AGAR|nr:hypothetical protein EST38_g1677 [Candolleomyces aberdarensis]